LKPLIENSLDFFYPPFKRFFDRTTYRYAACGGVNTVFDIFLFFISYNFILEKQNLDLSFLVISPHIDCFSDGIFGQFPDRIFIDAFHCFYRFSLARQGTIFQVPDNRKFQLVSQLFFPQIAGRTFSPLSNCFKGDYHIFCHCIQLHLPKAF